jgi:hypothetical protein
LCELFDRFRSLEELDVLSPMEPPPEELELAEVFKRELEDELLRSLPPLLEVIASKEVFSSRLLSKSISSSSGSSFALR